MLVIVMEGLVMRILLFFITLIIYLGSFQLMAAPNHVPRDVDDHGPNLPAIGSSLFDKIYSKKNSSGQVVHDVPYPLDQFLSRIGMSGNFVHIMMPFSRSLQRPNNLSYDPILNPRIVFSPREDLFSLTRGKLFFGYVEARDQLEVISYNDEAGRFEYQIITDYSKDPKVFYVNRGKCLSCHQGQAPIFSPPGWSDTSVGIMGRLIDTKLKLNGTTRDKWIESLFGVNKTQEQVAVFDSLVRESNSITFDERTWVYGCGGDNKCRLGLLINTLSRNSRYTEQYVEHSRSIIENSPLVYQNYFSSFLTDFDIGAKDVVKKYGSLLNVVTSSDALLELITNIYNLSPKDNPATKRSFSLIGKDLVRPLSGFLNSDLEILRAEIQNTNTIAEVLIDLFNQGHFIFAQDAINKLDVMAAVLEKVNSPKAKQYSQWSHRLTPEKKLFDRHIQPVFATAQLNILSRHCSTCHASGLDFPPQYLLGSEQEVIGKVTQLKEKMLFKLQNNLMPPNPADRDVLKNTGDYDRVIDYLNSL